MAHRHMSWPSSSAEVWHGSENNITTWIHLAQHTSLTAFLMLTSMGSGVGFKLHCGPTDIKTSSRLYDKSGCMRSIPVSEKHSLLGWASVTRQQSQARFPKSIRQTRVATRNRCAVTLEVGADGWDEVARRSRVAEFCIAWRSCINLKAHSHCATSMSKLCLCVTLCSGTLLQFKCRHHSCYLANQYKHTVPVVSQYSVCCNYTGECFENRAAIWTESCHSSLLWSCFPSCIWATNPRNTAINVP